MLIGAVEGSVEATLLILTAIILAGPLLAERLKVPGLIGLIFGGMVVGPAMLGWIEIDGLMSDLGAIGLLYLMFLAGLSFDLRSFSQNRTAAVTYGLLGFSVPFLLSIFVAMVLLDYSFLASLLIGAMWASNTLVAYPDVHAAGLAGNRAVGTAVSAGVIADILSLTVLAIVSSAEVLEGEDATASNPDPSMPLWLGLLLLAVFTLVVLPLFTRWFFVRVGHTRTQRFVFVLSGMAAGGVVALIGGIEGLVGAFLAGLGMNRLVPARGPLMERIEFFGAALFIPAFLISIGLSIDPRAMFNLETIALGLVFTALVVFGKTGAAAITTRIYKFSFAEFGVMSALSMGQAASTLAIAQVGITLGLFDQQVVNAAVLAIVATAFITSFGTRYFAGRIERPETETKPLGDTVVVDVRADGAELHGMLQLAGAIAAPDDGLIVPYAVSQSGQKGAATSRVERAVTAAERLGLDTEGEIRIGDSFPNDTVGVAEEVDASLLMIRWHGPRFPADYMFGTEIDSVGSLSPVPTIAAHIIAPPQRLVIATGDTRTAWRLADVELAFDVGQRLQKGLDIPAVVFSTDEELLENNRSGFEDATLHKLEAGTNEALEHLQPNDLVLMPTRVIQVSGALSQRRLARSLQGVSVAIIGGAGRLTVSPGVVRRQVQGVVGTTR
jgi:Kef-type K+ transport system membrane component KefB